MLIQLQRFNLTSRRWWWNPTWSLEEENEHFGYLSSGMEFQLHRKIGKLDWSSSYTRRETGENALTTGTYLHLASLEKCMPSALRKAYHEVIQPKLEDTQCGFWPGRSTTDQTFALQRIFEKCWEYAKDINECFVNIGKAYAESSRKALWNVAGSQCRRPFVICHQVRTVARKSSIGGLYVCAGGLFVREGRFDIQMWQKFY